MSVELVIEHMPGRSKISYRLALWRGKELLGDKLILKIFWQ